MQNHNLKFKIIIVFIFIGIAVGAWLMNGGRIEQKSALDSFARCLTEKGFVMYGAYRCSHCQNEKKAFGNSFRFVGYVECTRETQKCLQNKIEGYPTWIFPNPSTGSGQAAKRLVGEQGIEKLAQESGCVLPR